MGPSLITGKRSDLLIQLQYTKYGGKIQLECAYQLERVYPEAGLRQQAQDFDFSFPDLKALHARVTLMHGFLALIRCNGSQRARG